MQQKSNLILTNFVSLHGGFVNGVLPEVEESCLFLHLPSHAVQLAQKYLRVIKMLRFRVRVRPRKMSGLEGLGSGPEGRLKRLRKHVTALVRHERIETTYAQCDEARGYAEKVS